MRAADTDVSFIGVHTQLIEALIHVVDPICRDMLGYECIITSANDGVHGENSRHYVGLAADHRTWTTENSGTQIAQADRLEIARQLRGRLGTSFFVYPEATHMHISYKPPRSTGGRRPWT